LYLPSAALAVRAGAVHQAIRTALAEAAEVFQDAEQLVQQADIKSLDFFIT
jgi:hypothetical protein